jgi:O-antigen/teichoic acid export membrane protein
MARIKRLAKEASWILVGQVAMILGALVLVRVLTEYLAPEQYGQVALVLTVAGLINASVMGVVSNGITRFYPIALEKHDLSGYMYDARRLLFYSTIVTVVFGLLLIIVLFSLGLLEWIGLVSVTLVMALFSGYNVSLSGIQNAARQRAIVAFHGGLDAWIKIGLVLGLIYWLGSSAMAVIIGFTCSSLLIFFSQLYFFRRIISGNQFHFSKSHKWLQQMWSYSFPFAAWGIIGSVQQNSARWSLEMFASRETVGLYTVVLQLGYIPLQVAASTTMTFLMPIIFSRAGDASSEARNENSSALIKRLVIIGLGVTIMATLVAAAFHAQIFNLFVNKSYYSASHFLPWAVFSGGIFSVGLICASKIMALLKTNKLIGASVGSSIIGIVAAFFGVYYFSLAGAVGSMVVHSLSYFIWVVINLRLISAKTIAE